MDEYKYKRWGIILKVAGLVGVILSGLWAVHTYSEDKTKEQNSFIFIQEASHELLLFTAGVYHDNGLVKRAILCYIIHAIYQRNHPCDPL